MAKNDADEPRARLIAEAMTKPVQKVLQVDGFIGDGGLGEPDADGHTLNAGLEYELRRTDNPVRVQVRKDADPAEVLILLRKITHWIEEDWDGLTQGWRGPSPDELPF